MLHEEVEEQTHDHDYLIVGYVRGCWGTRGEIKVDIMTDFPDRFEPHQKVYIDGHALTIEKSHPRKDHYVLKLSTVNDIQSERYLQGKALEIPLSKARTLPEGEYYRFQIIGLEVVSTEGETVGRIVDILPTVSNDVYIVQSPKGDILIPAIEDVVKSIDLEKGQMFIEIISGLL